MFDAGRRFFEEHEDVSGEQLYAHMVSLAEEAGWEFGGSIAGHLVGQFPHEKISGDDGRVLHRSRQRSSDAQA